MPRESYNVRVLRAKALSSFRRGVAAFNGVESDGRVTVILLSFQHAFEMLLSIAKRVQHSDCPCLLIAQLHAVQLLAKPYRAFE